MSDCLLAIDQGTTSTRVLAFGLDRTILAQHQVPLKQHYPMDGWVEHDAEEIWQAVLTCLTHVLEHLEGRAKPVGIGITNQRETTVVWDRASGTPLHRAIVWQDRRTAKACELLSKEKGFAAEANAVTGLLLDPYFSGTKLAWLLDDLKGPSLRNLAADGTLAFGTVESYLVYRLTGGTHHVSDATNASRTLLCDINTGTWSDVMLDHLKIPSHILPEIVDCCGDFGCVAGDLPGRGLPITGLAGDQQSAAIGQACLSPGDMKSTYGTGCFLLQNTGDTVVRSANKLLSTIAYQMAGKRHYAVEGSIFNAGTVVQWLRDDLGVIESAAESEDLVQTVPDTGGVYMVPAFTGLGAPHWSAEARGLITGITRATGKAHLVRAGLESVAYQTADLFSALKADGAAAPTKLRIDGGMAQNSWFAQFLSDICDVPVERPASVETTALGAALCAGVGLGIWPDLAATANEWSADAAFKPQMDPAIRFGKRDGWDKAVRQCLTGTETPT